ncbi:hypothetical protein [Microbispora triticiradicis]|uniref:hypothetical protein n=1 Tax=Microbispora triticiradicis TaxID=2200763 RepID=UPI001AD7818F|nr:hypothetical protein [Microbispora triticiradicis]
MVRPLIAARAPVLAASRPALLATFLSTVVAVIGTARRPGIVSAALVAITARCERPASTVVPVLGGVTVAEAITSPEAAAALTLRTVLVTATLTLRTVLISAALTAVGAALSVRSAATVIRAEGPATPFVTLPGAVSASGVVTIAVRAPRPVRAEGVPVLVGTAALAPLDALGPAGSLSALLCPAAPEVTAPIAVAVASAIPATAAGTVAGAEGATVAIVPVVAVAIAAAAPVAVAVGTTGPVIPATRLESPTGRPVLGAVTLPVRTERALAAVTALSAVSAVGATPAVLTVVAVVAVVTEAFSPLRVAATEASAPPVAAETSGALRPVSVLFAVVSATARAVAPVFSVHFCPLLLAHRVRFAGRRAPVFPCVLTDFWGFVLYPRSSREDVMSVATPLRPRPPQPSVLVLRDEGHRVVGGPAPASLARRYHRMSPEGAFLIR